MDPPMLTVIDLAQWKILVLFLCMCLVPVLIVLRAKQKESLKSPTPPIFKNDVEPTTYPPVEPLPDFEWQKTEPLNLRPFKPKYHLTMSIEDSTLSELIEIDKNYVDRIALRKEVMKRHPEDVLGAEDCIKMAVDEFYTWLVGTDLPTRFPRMFKVIGPASDQPSLLHNLATGEKFCLHPADKPLETLRTMGDQLFTAHGNHLYEGESIPKEDLDIDKVRVRCERQFVHRLPQTRGILFSFKTYLYTLPEIKADCLGETLAQAIDGLKEGSVPEFHFYKRAAVWGESAKAYLLG
ncbi:hypothetical protein SI65_00873 [Aspergillus cristatus]|uniref:Uncharacterized protein n=1 Tax=Aspergillus cristatus TaxID=573508 RepID=A0A1E3BQM9_ASPCR|nr:hypothetical protein SI65_00873 [Aspergillus cristatus]